MEIDDGVWIRFRANVDDIQQKMASLPGVIQGAANQLSSAFNLEKLSIGAIALGSSLTQALSVPIANIKEQSLTAFAGFEASMARVQAMTGETKNSLQGLNAQALELGSTTQFSATKIATAMGDLASAGLNTKEILAAIPGVLDFAAAGQMKLADAAKVSTQVMHEFGMAAGDMGKIADVIAYAASKSSAEVSDMGVAFQYFGPIAKIAGISMQQTAAAFEILADAGVRGSKAGTAMRQMIANLENPSNKAAEAMQRLGISVKDAEGHLLPLDQLLERLRPLTEHTAEGFQIFGKRFSEVVSLLEKGPEKFREMTAAVEEANGASGKMAATLMQGYQGELKRFNDELDSMKVKIGNALAPAAEAMLKNFGEPVVKMVGNLADGFTKLPLPIQQVGLAFTTMAQYAGPAIVMLGQLGLAWPLITQGASLAASTLAGLVPSIATLGSVAAGAAAAFAGWKLGEWLYTNIGFVKAFGDALGGLILKIPGVEYAINRLNGVTAAQSSFASSVAMLEAKLKAQGVVIDRAGLSMEEYAAKLRRAAIEHAPVVTGTERVTAALKSQPPAIEETARAYQKQAASAQASMQASMAAAQKQIADAQAHAAAIQLAQQRGEALKRTLESISVAHLKADTEAWAASIRGLDADFERLNAVIMASGDHTAEFGDAAALVAATLDQASESATQIPPPITAAATETQRFAKETSGLSRMWDDAIRGLARGIGDVIVNGKSAGDVFLQLGKNMLSAFADQTLHAGIKALIGNLFSIQGEATKATASVKGLGDVMSKVFGSGGSGSGAGGGGGAAGGGSGLAGVVGAIGSMGTMISSIIGNFQNARMETTLNAIEESTRYAKSYLRDNIIPLAQQYWPRLDNTVQLIRLEGIEETLKRIADNGIGQGGFFTDMLRALQQLPPEIGQGLGEGLNALAQGLGQGLQQAFAPMVQGINDLRNIVDMKLTQQTVFLQAIALATTTLYNVMAKPGWVATGQSGSSGNQLPTSFSTGSGSPGSQTQYNVIVNSNGSNPYTFGQNVVQGINSQLAVRI